MTPRRVAGFFLTVLLSLPLFAAVAPGLAEGTITIHGKPVKMKYAFAMKEKDYDKKDRWVVILTDRAVSRALLGDSTRMSEAIDAGQLAAAILRFDEKKELNQAEIKSKALKHEGVPLSTSKMKLTAPSFTATSVSGAAATTEEMSFFDDVAGLDVRFNAPLGQDKFDDNTAAAKELAAAGPKVSDGQASGALKVDGKTVKLTHASARVRPNSFDEKKKDVVVLLSQVPVAADVFSDRPQAVPGSRERNRPGAAREDRLRREAVPPDAA